jgi:hypothetical protein
MDQRSMLLDIANHVVSSTRRLAARLVRRVSFATFARQAASRRSGNRNANSFAPRGIMSLHFWLRPVKRAVCLCEMVDRDCLAVSNGKPAHMSHSTSEKLVAQVAPTTTEFITEMRWRSVEAMLLKTKWSREFVLSAHRISIRTVHFDIVLPIMIVVERFG